MGVGSALAARTAALAASGERANTSAPGEPSRSTFGLRSHSGSRMLVCWPFAWPLLPASSTGPCFVNELLIPCVYARFGVVAVRAVAAGAVSARRGSTSASSAKKEGGGGGGHRLPAIGRERTATSVSRHSAARGRAGKGERHCVSPRGHGSRHCVSPRGLGSRHCVSPRGHGSRHCVSPRGLGSRTHVASGQRRARQRTIRGEGAHPLAAHRSTAPIPHAITHAITHARARTLSQRFEAWFPFRSHWPCGDDVLRLQIELLNGPLPLELGLPDLLQRDADDEAAVSLRPIKL